MIQKELFLWAIQLQKGGQTLIKIFLLITFIKCLRFCVQRSLLSIYPSRPCFKVRVNPTKLLRSIVDKCSRISVCTFLIDGSRVTILSLFIQTGDFREGQRSSLVLSQRGEVNYFMNLERSSLDTDLRVESSSPLIVALRTNSRLSNTSSRVSQ